MPLRLLLLSCALHAAIVAALAWAIGGDGMRPRRIERPALLPSRMQLEAPPPDPLRPVIQVPECEVEPVELLPIETPEPSFEEIAPPQTVLVETLPPRRPPPLRSNPRIVAEPVPSPMTSAPAEPPPRPTPSTAPAAVAQAEVPVVLPGHNPPPAYPDAARRRRIEGTVIVRIDVDAAGAAIACTVASSSGSALLDAAALAAARRWRFARGPGSLEQPFRFALAGT